jgi:hypothetical protein
MKLVVAIEMLSGPITEMKIFKKFLNFLFSKFVTFFSSLQSPIAFAVP